jgi:putative tricarboxylic transport membrane protein
MNGIEGRGRVQQVVVAGAVLAAGVAVLIGAGMISQPMAGAAVGPRAAAYGVGALIAACGALLLAEALRGGWLCEATDDDANGRPDLWPMIVLGLGMLANVMLIKTTGFIIATTIMFVFTARAFGARRLWVAALIGFSLALATYYGFARLLDLRIGGGWIEDLL